MPLNSLTVAQSRAARREETMISTTPIQRLARALVAHINTIRWRRRILRTLKERRRG
jgi:histone H3/H4